MVEKHEQQLDKKAKRTWGNSNRGRMKGRREMTSPGVCFGNP